MLAQTVRSNLKDINNLRMRSKTTKFSSLFSTEPTVEMNRPEIRQVLMKDGLITIDEDDSLFDEISQYEEAIDTENENIEIIEDSSEIVDVNEEEIAEYIVENPNEVVVQFPILSDIKLEERLPFFKAVSMKLASL